MKCIMCGCELSEEMFTSDMCFNCGASIQPTVQAVTDDEEKKSAKRAAEIATLKEREKQEQLHLISNHKTTTGYNFENHTITEYIGLVSGEIVIGTGWLSSFESGISDMFGTVSHTYSEKIKLAKEAAIADMIQQSVTLGGNAIIGVSFEFITFSGDMIGVSANGTSVKILKEEILPEERR